MKWISTNVVYDEFPLYLRRPDYQDVWNYKIRFTQRLNISHHLDKVKQNGLPESDYNLSLSDFDSDLCNLFDDHSEGIIFLIETYGGERNYWYYISEQTDYLNKIERIRQEFPNNAIESDLNDDTNWGFIKSYPFEIYNK
ncbi:DUF695 domain-containing protein [Pedobacter frigidisoli]|nr:DUF695 domain-containing protein [Pedobacter frigidisoli]